MYCHRNRVHRRSLVPKHGHARSQESDYKCHHRASRSFNANEGTAAKMAKRKRQHPAKNATIVTPQIAALLGSSPLLSTEDQRSYDGTLDMLARAVRPGDPIAWFLVKDLADLRFEIDRYRRIKSA